MTARNLYLRLKSVDENTMANYTEKTTDELIDLLLKEEDRATLEHIQELAARSDAIEPLREILRSDYYWDEGRYGEYWVLYHAFTILSATRNPELLTDIINALMKAYETEFDWIQEISPAALAYFGEPAVEPLLSFVKEHRDSYQDDWNYTYLRSRAVTALARIGLEHPASREKITDFLCSLLTDPDETDPTFLGFIVDDVLTVDRERGIAAARDAFERDAVDETISGDFEEAVELFDEYKESREWQYTQDLFEFYRPEEIARRQERWKREEEAEKRWEAKRGEMESVKASGGYKPEPSRWTDAPPITPAGYTRIDGGAIVRDEKIGRNDPCPCGSGKKYKKCHGQ
jgi:hypothetical protein